MKTPTKHSSKKWRPGPDKATKKTQRPPVSAARNDATHGAVRFSFTIIFIVAFALRLIHQLQIQSITLFYQLAGDGRTYYEWAPRIATRNQGLPTP